MVLLFHPFAYFFRIVPDASPRLLRLFETLIKHDLVLCDLEEAGTDLLILLMKVTANFFDTAVHAMPDLVNLSL